MATEPKPDAAPDTSTPSERKPRKMNPKSLENLRKGGSKATEAAPEAGSKESAKSPKSPKASSWWDVFDVFG